MMIFAAETEECSLVVFPDALTAASYCEGPHVEACVWLFWDDDGEPLQPEFTIPNKRGLFTCKSGCYHLVSVEDDHRPALVDSLPHIRSVIGESPFTSIGSVREYLSRNAPDSGVSSASSGH